MPPRPATIRVVLCATAGIVAAAPAAAGAAAVDLPFAVVDEATDFVLGPPVIARAGAALGPRAIVLYTRPGVVGLVWVRTPSRGHPKGEGAVSTRLRSSDDASHSEYLRRPVPGDGPVGSSRALDLTVGAEFSFTATPTAAFAAVLSRRPLRLAGPSRPNGRHGRIADHAAARTSVVVARRPEGWVGLMLTGTRADRRAMLAAVDWTALDRDLGDI